MAKFSTKERLIASLLSSTPRIKRIVKRFYVYLNYIIYKKDYNYKFLTNKINGDIKVCDPTNPKDETFFGYYDKSPENLNGLVIFNETARPTKVKPSPKKPMAINIMNSRNGHVEEIAQTFSYTWQQGARAQWISNARLLYNFFDEGRYQCALYDIESKSIIKTFNRPVQDSFGEEYYLSINYARIMNLRPDYGYRNLPRLTNKEMAKMDNDGIWRISISDSQDSLLLSLAEIASLPSPTVLYDAQHKVNHVMISPDGKGFIFIHRRYVGKRRFDRLIYYDYKVMRVLADENMVSHMCWIDNDTVFGYLRLDGKDGFYFIDIHTGEHTPCHELTALGYGDGHPSAYKNWIVVDTYPDKSRMQHLYLFNTSTKKIVHLLEVFHGISFEGESRCDLHPRFSPDGYRIYFDTVCKGKRRLASIDISNIIL